MSGRSFPAMGGGGGEICSSGTVQGECTARLFGGRGCVSGPILKHLLITIFVGDLWWLHIFSGLFSLFINPLNSSFYEQNPTNIPGNGVPRNFNLFFFTHREINQNEFFSFVSIFRGSCLRTHQFSGPLGFVLRSRFGTKYAMVGIAQGTYAPVGLHMAETPTAALVASIADHDRAQQVNSPPLLTAHRCGCQGRGGGGACFFFGTNPR